MIIAKIYNPDIFICIKFDFINRYILENFKINKDEFPLFTKIPVNISDT